MRDRFPKDFLWGAATSSHQVEGNNTHNDWWEWEQSGGTEPSGMACDHYHKFREDFHIAKGLGHNAHRFSLEWSRLEQDEGVFDQSEWLHYVEVVNELRSLEIEPIVTLNHFTLPLWLSKKGGWENEESIKHFTNFAGQAIEHLGHKVQYWMTINEPNVLASLSYYTGKWPPHSKSFDDMILALTNMLKSHAEAYRVIHEIAQTDARTRKPKVGIAKCLTAFHPCSRFSIMDRFAAHRRNDFLNHCFIKSLMEGHVDIPGAKKEKLALKKSLDFIGLNYYSRQFIHFKKPLSEYPFGEICSLEHHKDAGETTNMGWEIYPKGLHDVLESLSCYNKPIMITENGLSTDDDAQRKKFIKDHLEQLLRIIKQGAPILGYLHWSLLDNFEWSEGYKPRFGIVGVNYETQERAVKDSARYLSEIIHSGKIH